MKMSVGPLSIIGIIFVVCKALAIGPIAAWSWLWVLAPFWIGFAIMGVILTFVLTVAVIAAVASDA